MQAVGVGPAPSQRVKRPHAGCDRTSRSSGEPRRRKRSSRRHASASAAGVGGLRPSSSSWSSPGWWLSTHPEGWEALGLRRPEWRAMAPAPAPVPLAHPN